MGKVDIGTLTMEQYLALTHGNQAPDIVSLFNILGFSDNAVMSRVFPITFTRAAKRWVDRLPSRTITPRICSKRLSFKVIANKLDILWRDTKKLKKNVYDIQVGCETCGGAHLDKECPLHEEVKSVEEVKYGEFGRSFPNNSGNNARYHVGPPGYYTRVDNRPPFDEKRPNLKELMNKHLEESTRRRADMEDWIKKLQESTNMNIRNQNASLKNLETQVEQLTKDYQAKVANEVPNSSIGQCKAIFADNEAPRDETSSNRTNELHGVSFISDDNVMVSKKMDEGQSGVLPCQLPLKELSPGSFTLPCTIDTKMVEPDMTTSRLHYCKPIQELSNGTFKLWPTYDPSVRECNRGDTIYGLDERGALKQWHCHLENERREVKGREMLFSNFLLIRYENSKIDDTIRARQYNEWSIGEQCTPGTMMDLKKKNDGKVV
ncbi:hypothetical protein Tco_1256901 [Tanacetum coccineum]